MVRIGQIGIALGTLGIVLALMGLFPGVTGLNPTAGIGVLQLITLLAGFTLLIVGAIIYAKYSFYAGVPSNFPQQIALRLALTGLLFAGMSAMADILGFGANPIAEGEDIFFGPWQAAGLIGSFLIAALGVLLYALTGPMDIPESKARLEGEIKIDPNAPIVRNDDTLILDAEARAKNQET